MILFARNASQSVTNPGLVFDNLITKLPLGFVFSPDNEKEQLLMLKHAYMIKLKYCEEMKDAQSTTDLKEFTHNIAQFIVRCHDTRDKFIEKFEGLQIFNKQHSLMFKEAINQSVDILRSKYAENHMRKNLDMAVDQLKSGAAVMRPKL